LARHEVFDMRAGNWTKFTVRAGPILIAAALLAGPAFAATALPPTVLSGDQEVPPVKTPASGGSHIAVHEDRSVTGTIETVAIDGISAHIHLGTPGTNGPVVVTLTKSGANEWSVAPGTQLTVDQYRSYTAGQMYVNVHSVAHAAGEIRLQLTP
jgi:hypothetical protein